MTELLGGVGDNPLRRSKTIVLLDLKQLESRAEAMTRVVAAAPLFPGLKPSRPIEMVHLGVRRKLRSSIMRSGQCAIA